MRELADVLGIKLGNLQYYFKTQETLILHVIEVEASRDVLTIQTHRQKTGAAKEVFRAIVQDLVARWHGDSGLLFSTLGMLSLHNKAYKRLYLTVYADFYQALEGPLRDINPKILLRSHSYRIALGRAASPSEGFATGAEYL